MPRRCTICSHSELAAIGKAIATGHSNRNLANRFNVSPAAIQRHRAGCLKQPRREKKVAPGSAPASVGGSNRFDSDGEIATPADLLERLRSLFRLGDLLEEAYQRRDVDACVKLAREYRSAAESYARVAGWMTDGASATVNIDARKQGLVLLGRMDEASLRSAIASLSAGGDAALVGGSGEAAIDVESRVVPP